MQLQRARDADSSIFRIPILAHLTMVWIIFFRKRVQCFLTLMERIPTTFSDSSQVKYDLLKKKGYAKAWLQAFITIKNMLHILCHESCFASFFKMHWVKN